MIRSATLVIVMCVLAVGTWAQGPPPGVTPPGHNHNDRVIDGAKNPELISDSIAYRMWLITVSELPDASEVDRNHQRAHLGGLGLPSLERAELVNILADFKIQYNNLIEIYNASVQGALARGVEPDLNGFLKQRDALVQATRGIITMRLSPEAATRIDERVQEHKRHVQIHTQVHTVDGGAK